MPGIGFLAQFKNGKLDGHFWLGLLGGGSLLGQVDEHGQMSGNDLAYIYPDGTTAFYGRFEDKFMIAGHHVEVLEYACDSSGMLYVNKFSDALSELLYEYDPCTNISFGGGSNVPLGSGDPYETKTVRLGTSSVPNSGDGVFLIRDVPAYKVVALYSLFLYKHPEETDLYHATCTENTSKNDEYRRDVKSIQSPWFPIVDTLICHLKKMCSHCPIWAPK